MLWFCFRWFCYNLIICLAHTSHIFDLGGSGELHALLQYLSAAANPWSVNRANSGEGAHVPALWNLRRIWTSEYLYLHYTGTRYSHGQTASKYCTEILQGAHKCGIHLCRWPFYNYPVCLCFLPCYCCLTFSPYCALRPEWSFSILTNRDQIFPAASQSIMPRILHSSWAVV